MAALDDDFAFVAASAERAARRQRESCQHLLSDLTRDGALARHLALGHNAIESQIEARRERFDEAPDDTVREDAIVEMRELLWYIRDLQPSVEWLAAADDSPLDLGTKYFVEGIARALIDEGVELTVVPTTKGSYATTWNPLEPLIQGWGEGMPKDSPTVLVVFIPRREENAKLLHPLIVHEIGHAADDRHGLVDSIWEQAQKRKRLSGRFEAAVTEFAEENDVDSKSANTYVTARLRSWIAEVLCDSIAAHQLGPSYLYSFLVEVGTASMDEATQNHPPPRQRIRHLLATLERGGWSETMADNAGVIDAWIRSQAAASPSYHGVERFLCWAVDDLRVVVRKTAAQHAGTNLFAPAPKRLAEILELLSVGVPPAQGADGAAIGRSQIVLGCWYAALAAAGGDAAALPAAADRPELGEVLPAALELSALTGSWEEQP